MGSHTDRLSVTSLTATATATATVVVVVVAAPAAKDRAHRLPLSSMDWIRLWRYAASSSGINNGREQIGLLSPSQQQPQQQPPQPQLQSQ